MLTSLRTAVSRSAQKPRKKASKNVGLQQLWPEHLLSLGKECWICWWLLQAQSTLERMLCSKETAQTLVFYMTKMVWNAFPHLSYLYNYKKSILLILLPLSFPDSHRKPAAATLLRSIYIAPICYFLHVPQIMQTLDKLGAYYFIYY